MGRPNHWRALAPALILLAGCSGGSELDLAEADPPGYVAPKADGNLPLVAHPEFTNWSTFPAGIVVVRKKEVSNDFGTLRVTTRLRLAEKSAEQVVVESQVTVDRPGSELVENPPQSMVFPANFRLPAGMKVEQFLLPALKAEDAGDQTLTVCGREFQARLFTWVERNEAGPMNVKHWRSDAIPGRMLRQEISGRTQKSIEEVVEIRPPDDFSIDPPKAPAARTGYVPRVRAIFNE